ncbi:MAG: pyridoxal phosphate-dependent aminotransferase [Thermodesulfobacteriota bacterium]|nr:pyridoxal phosphate-dependent aminotransferase [Thermodesulfobacteriota bacterium]
MVLARRMGQIKPSPTLSLNAKAAALREAGVDVLSFAAGEPDFNTPEHIKAAGIKAIEDNFTRYTAAGGILELKEAIAAKFKKDNGLSYAAEQIVVSCGGKHTLYNLAQVLWGEGDEVVIPAPYWVSYPPIVQLAGAEPVIASTQEANEFKMTPADLERAVTPRTKALIMNAPSNPTGAVYSREELEGLAEVVLKHDLMVISDDIYEKIIYDGLTFSNMANISPELEARTIIAHGLAKTYSMTGWRIGFMAGPKEVAAAVTKVQSQSTSNPCSIAQKAAVAALTGPEDFVAVMRAAFDERRLFIVEALKTQEGVTCFKPGGSFYVFPNVSAYYGKSFDGWEMTGSADMAEYLLERALVAVVPGEAFGEDACVRLSYATSMENIKEGLKRIFEALDKLS